MNPLARKDGLLVRELAEEVVAYDVDRHEAHCLNPTAAFVFKNSDGRASVGDIATRLHADEPLVWLALERLGEAGLLEQSPAPPPERGGWSRRDVVRRMGLGLSVLLPAVTSILVPTPAEAAVTCVAAGACAGNPGPSCYIANPALCDGSCTCQPGICPSNCCDTGALDCSF